MTPAAHAVTRISPGSQRLPILEVHRALCRPRRRPALVRDDEQDVLDLFLVEQPFDFSRIRQRELPFALHRFADHRYRAIAVGTARADAPLDGGGFPAHGSLPVLGRKVERGLELPGVYAILSWPKTPIRSRTIMLRI